MVPVHAVDATVGRTHASHLARSLRPRRGTSYAPGGGCRPKDGNHGCETAMGLLLRAPGEPLTRHCLLPCCCCCYCSLVGTLGTWRRTLAGAPSSLPSSRPQGSTRWRALRYYYTGIRLKLL